MEGATVSGGLDHPRRPAGRSDHSSGAVERARVSGKDDSRGGLSALFRFAARGDAAEDQVHRLLEVNRALAGERDPVRLYTKILDAAVELTGAERAFLVLAAAVDAEPDIVASRNVDHEEVRSP